MIFKEIYPIQFLAGFFLPKKKPGDTGNTGFLINSFSKTNKPFEMSLVPSESYDIELYDIDD